jgi:WD40 repeat protein
MMAEMAAASRGETPHTKPVGAASTGEARPAATALKAGAGEKEQASDGSDNDGDDDEEDSGEEEDMGKGGLVPCTHEAIIKASTKAITAMSIDPSAARLLTGGHDCGIKMYDFNGMNQNLNHFREVAVWEGQPLVSMQYSNSGDKILVATTKNTAVLFSREGSREADFMKGDMYVHDMAQTKGHVAALCGACWHPTDRNTCLTGSLDGTVRLWDVNECTKKQVTVIKTKNAKGQKATPSAVCYTCKGDIVAACDDGTIKIYDGRAVAKGSTQRAHNEAKTAHQPGTNTTSVTVSRDCNMMISRGGDDTLKAWDMRKLSQALAAYEGLDNYFEQTQCIFSPGDHLFLTGTSVRKNKDGSPAGQSILHVYDKSTLQLVRKEGVPSGSIVTMQWHPKINQLFLGSSSGQVHCLYDPKQSEHGIIRAVGKVPKKADLTNVGIGSVGYIFTPNALKAFRDDNMETKALT